MEQTVAQVKFFATFSNWTWYGAEADALVDGEWTQLTAENYDTAEEVKFFGLVDGHTPELGYFTLSQLQGVTVERDRHFQPTTLDKLR